MKNFLKLITLIFLTLLAFNKNSFSCDNLKNVKVGEDFSKSLEILYFIDGYNQEDFDEDVTVEYQSDTDEYCPKMGLENTILKVFIYDSKIAGLRIETWDIEVQENEIYNFVKSYYAEIVFGRSRIKGYQFCRKIFGLIYDISAQLSVTNAFLKNVKHCTVTVSIARCYKIKGI